VNSNRISLAGYGVDTVRVDGNDVLAVMNAVKEARRLCLEGGRAVLVEMMTYRVGHHSTSDDSYAYRERQDVEDRKKNDSPITRFRLFMESRGWWNETDEEELLFRLRRDVIKALKRAEIVKKPGLEDMFTDVYAEEPWNIVSQWTIQRRVLILATEGTAGGANGTAQEIWTSVGAMAK
jgi:2-oxoisovalerate dehydrogenase E1 component alpha subunit